MSADSLKKKKKIEQCFGWLIIQYDISLFSMQRLLISVLISWCLAAIDYTAVGINCCALWEIVSMMMCSRSAE